MVHIDEERCTGCGLCVEACPTAAISLMDGVARIEQTLCRECEVCLPICPNGAILALREPIAIQKPTLMHAPLPTSASAQSVARAPRTSSVWPRASAALAWIGRELVPRAAALLEDWGEWQPRPASSSRARAVSGRMRRSRAGRGRRAQHQRRGRW
jgi:Fe-S-cluster-containing hydrogenase component 2